MMETGNCIEMVGVVADSWENVKQNLDYAQIIGHLLFQKLFELEPDRKSLFAFTKEAGRGEDEYNTLQFRHKSRSILKMVDLTVGLAGRDLDTVVHLCQELGARHYGFGVSSCHYNAFGIALIYAIETVLGDSWNPKVQEGWTAIYELISTAMMDGAETVIKDNDDDDQSLRGVGGIKQRTVSNKQMPNTTMSGPVTVIKAETPASGDDRRRQFMALSSMQMSESKLHSPYHRNMERRPSTGKPRTRRSCERTPTAKAPRRKVKSPMAPSTSPVAGDDGGKRRSARARLAVDLAMDLSGHSGHSRSAHNRRSLHSSASSNCSEISNVSYTGALDEVGMTWDVIKGTPNYTEALGVEVFKRFFTISPQSRALFSFGKELSGGDDNTIYNSSMFLSHTKSFVRMIDTAVNMLGPDLELLGESLQQLGAKHARYGVEPSHFIALGESLFDALEKLSKDAWSASAEEGWTGMYTYISTMMLRGVQDYNDKYGGGVGVELEDAVQGTKVLAL